MNRPQIFVLPGLDGNGLLLSRFCDLAPPGLDASVWPIPDDPGLNYESLCDHFSTRIEEFGNCHLIAESFSGPLGILLAYRHPQLVRRLTLVASFAKSPLPSFARLIPWSIVFRLPMPSLVVRAFFTGGDSSVIPEIKNSISLTSCSTLVQRTHCIMNVDVTKELSKLTCRLEYLRPTRDKLVSRKSMNTIINSNPAMAVREIDGPHLLLETRPNECWNAIT